MTRGGASDVDIAEGQVILVELRVYLEVKMGGIGEGVESNFAFRRGDAPGARVDEGDGGEGGGVVVGEWI